MNVSEKYSHRTYEISFDFNWSDLYFRFVSFRLETNRTTMDDEIDLDLVDELCTSFSTPCSSQTLNLNVNESSTRSRRKRTSTMSAILETSITKKVCFDDLTNRSTREPFDEFTNLDESALQLMVKHFLFFDIFFYFR